MRPHFSALTLVCLPLIPLISCSASNSSKTPDAKIKLVDSKVVDGAAACAAKSSYGAVTFGSNDVQQASAGSNSMQPAVGYIANISEANPIDLLDIELWIGGTGTDFPTALANGTYNLAMKGDNNYNNCDACVLVWPQMPLDGSGDLDPGSDYFNTSQYMASSGTMTLTSVTTNITGTLSNVALRHVTFDGSNDESDATDGCMTTITSASFTAPITAASFNGKTDEGADIHFTLHHRYR